MLLSQEVIQHAREGCFECCVTMPAFLWFGLSRTFYILCTGSTVNCVTFLCSATLRKGNLRKYSPLKSSSDFLDTQLFFSWSILWLNYVNLRVGLSCVVGILHYDTEWNMKWRKKPLVFVSSQTYRNAKNTTTVVHSYQLPPDNRLEWC